MSIDRVSGIAQIRPNIKLDDLWSPQEQAAARERIMLSPRSNSSNPRQRRRRFAAVAVAVAALIVPGFAAAVGNGMKPQAFFDVYTYWRGDSTGLDASSPKRVATAPGPYGGVFSVIAVKNSAGERCLTPVFETSASARAKLPENFEGGPSFCYAEPSGAAFGRPTDVEFTRTAAVWWGRAGEGVRGDIRFGSGESYPAVVVEGYLFGWYPPEHRAASVAPPITVYRADGTVLGEARL